LQTNEAAEIHKYRFAVRRNSNTEPETAATVAILITLRAAVDSTIGKRQSDDAACFPLELNRFFPAMIAPL
jgi:hypothetical protein